LGDFLTTKTNKMKLEKTTVISEENALQELSIFISKWVKRPPKDEELADTYPDILDALMSGHLVIDSETQVPVYNLVHPVLNDKGEVSKSVVNFKTRIKPNAKANLASGINLQKDAALYGLVVISHIIGCTRMELDKFENIDYDVISQLSTVFM
jgi:hypothetical protein